MKQPKKHIYKKAFATFLALLLVAEPVSTKFLGTSLLQGVRLKISSEDFQTWKKMHSVDGKCLIMLPRTPEHIQQQMAISGKDEKMKYDVYVADHQRKEVFMLLIAEYPGEVDKENAVKNLEHFLNTIIAQNPKNVLQYADLVTVQGYPAMNFHIRTESVYFKGQAVQANNTLYLLAMECEVQNYQDHHFNYFVESFELTESCG